MKMQFLCTNKNAKRAAAAVAIFSIVYHIPYIFLFKLESEMDSTSGQIANYTAKLTDFWIDNNLLFHSHYLYIIFVFIIPFGLLFYFNTKLFLQVKMSKFLFVKRVPEKARKFYCNFCTLFFIIDKTST